MGQACFTGPQNKAEAIIDHYEPTGKPYIDYPV